MTSGCVCLGEWCGPILPLVINIRTRLSIIASSSRSTHRYCLKSIQRHSASTDIVQQRETVTVTSRIPSARFLKKRRTSATSRLQGFKESARVSTSTRPRFSLSSARPPSQHAGNHQLQRQQRREKQGLRSRQMPFRGIPDACSES